MDLLYDFNHVVNLKMASGNDTFQLIPDTGISDTLVHHKNCNMCGNSQRKKWSSLVPPLSKQNMTHSFDYFYLLHQWTTELTGHHYKDSICLSESTRSCTTNVQILAIENARPYFYSLADGYLGLGADLGWNKDEGSSR